MVYDIRNLVEEYNPEDWISCEESYTNSKESYGHCRSSSLPNQWNDWRTNSNRNSKEQVLIIYHGMFVDKVDKAQLKPSGQRFYEVRWSVNSMLENSDHRKSRKSLSIQYLNLN